MKNFFEKNKIFLAIIIAAFIIGGSIYLSIWQFSNRSKPPLQSELSLQSFSPLPSPSKGGEEQISTPLPSGLNQQPKKVNIPPERIITQLKYFDNFLEGKLLDADISCHVLAVYNNVKASDPNSESFKTGFPETEETYIERCRSSYLKVSQEENTLIAEPELKEIREKITKYIQEVKTIALFALDGGHDVSVINEYEKNIDQLRLETREAILKAKRQYNISF